MSMLAERKRKQKWSLNPRGKEWSQDANKFGQKMLERMGWQHGKGLGAKEDGITEHVKVSYKNDSKGMGYKETNDQWTEHEDNFSALLESLSGTKVEVDGSKIKSLEEKSQISKARVHYHKFTRGKDLSRASEKDLANIFGRKTLKPTVKKEEVVVDKESVKENNSDFLVNAGSMMDYFKKKLPSFGKINGYVVGNNGVLKKDESEESEGESRPAFGFGYKSNDNNTEFNKKKSSFISYVTETSEDSKNNKRKQEGIDDEVLSPKKKHKKDKDSNKNEVIVINDDDTPRKKRNNEISGVSNPAFNPLGTPIKVNKHRLETIEENDITGYNEEVEEDATKNKQKKDENTLEQINDTKKKEKKRRKSKNDLDTIIENDECITSTKKKQLKRNFDETAKKTTKEGVNESTGISNPAFNPLGTSIKVNKHHLDPIDENEVTLNSKEVNENKVKKKKKGKRDKNEQSGISNPAFNPLSNSITIKTINENEITIIDDEINEVERKKKKKNKNDCTGVSNPAFNPISTSINVEHHLEPINENEITIIDDEINEVEKKKKKKNKNGCTGVSNPAFNPLNTSIKVEHLEPIDENEVTIINDEINEVDRKKKKRNKNEYTGVSNPAFNQLETTNNEVKRKNKESVVSNHNNEEMNKKSKKKKNKNDVIVIEDDINEESNKKSSNKRNKYAEIDNPVFSNESFEEPINNCIENPYEVKLNKKKKKKVNDSKLNENLDQINETKTGISNPGLNLNDSIDLDCDLMLNVVSTPITETSTNAPTKQSNKIRKVATSSNNNNNKRVRFSDVNQEVIIPNNEQLKYGVDNANFDLQRNHLDENVAAISKTLDNYQAEIENDMNEDKVRGVTVEDLMVGEVGDPDGEDELLPDGAKLKFKNANLDARSPLYHLDKVGPKKSYKHLIKGDIVVKFKNANLHQIKGYAVKNAQ